MRLVWSWDVHIQSPFLSVFLKFSLPGNNWLRPKVGRLGNIVTLGRKFATRKYDDTSQTQFLNLSSFNVNLPIAAVWLKICWLNIFSVYRFYHFKIHLCALLVPHFWKKIEIRCFFAMKRRYFRLCLRKRTLPSYDNLVRISILKIVSQRNPIDVPKFTQ